MKKIDIVVIGAGLYVCGKGTDGYGTILPAIFEWKRNNKNIGDVHCVSTSAESSQKLLEKAKELEVKTGITLNIKSYPKNGSKNHMAYKEVLDECKKPACVIIAVPDHLHYQIAKDSLNAGLHTLIVKPLTPTYAEGYELMKLAKNNDLDDFAKKQFKATKASYLGHFKHADCFRDKKEFFQLITFLK